MKTAYTTEITRVEKREGPIVELYNGTYRSRHPQHTVVFVYASDLVPKEWNGWFWNDLANCDVTWGDAAHTLVEYSKFVQFCNEILDSFPDFEDLNELTEEYARWLETLESDTDTLWVDLEA